MIKTTRIWKYYKKNEGTIQIIIRFIGLMVALGTGAYFKNYLIILLNYDVEFKIWQFIISLFAFSILIFIYKYNKSKSVKKFLKYGLEWHAKINNNKVNLEGPFCPHCQFEMTDLKPFYCEICDKNYPAVETNNMEDVKRIVEKIIEAELRNGKTLIVDWSMIGYSYPNSHLLIKNNGASSAKNVSIKINLKINQQTRIIGTYDVQKIDPDQEVKIKNSDPMKNVHAILEELKLITILTQDTGPIEIEDEWGIPRLVSNYIEWKSLKKNFSCILCVNLLYSLRNKKKNEETKYVLEFKRRNVAPWDTHDHEDNCEIYLRQI